MKKISNVVHDKICTYPPENPFGYFGWPSITKTSNGTLIAAGSGFRNTHVCPFGKSVVFRSNDQGNTWSDAQIAVTSQIDVRDCGLTPLSNNRVLLSYFTSDTRFYYPPTRNSSPKGINFGPLMASWNDDMVANELGSFTRILEADGTIGPRRAVPVSAPHGPIVGKDGALYYAGSMFGKKDERGNWTFSMQNYKSRPVIALYKSLDEGENWLPVIEDIPLEADEENLVFCEPHLIEKTTGGFIIFLRGETGPNKLATWSVESDVTGTVWSAPKKIATGAPPHVMRHSSGVLILSTGFRQEPYGEMVSFSIDDGATWDADYFLHDDGICSDLGYPSTVELDDGSLMTAYYQSPAHFTPPGILCTKWELPDKYKKDFNK